jgi:hypothetical protein
LRVYHHFTSVAKKETMSSRVLIDEVIEPLLQSPGVINLLAYQMWNTTVPENKNKIYIQPRARFIENANLLFNEMPIQEKTQIQAALDKHWYGEADEILLYPATLSLEDQNDLSVPKKLFAVVDSDTDKMIYDPNIELVITNNDVNSAEVPYIKLNVTPTNTSGLQEGANRYKRFGIRYNNTRTMNSFNAMSLSNALSSSIVVKQEAIAEFISAQVISAEGTLLIYGTKSGIMGAGKINETFSNNKISLTINQKDDTNPFIIGDAFVFEVEVITNELTNKTTSRLKQGSILATNVAGKFEIIEESQLNDDILNSEFDPNNIAKSWIIVIDRVEDINGLFLYWNIISRNLSLIAESPLTKFWYNNNVTLIDQQTKRKVRDVISILKSNLNKDGDSAIGENQPFDVVGNAIFADGTVNPNALTISPTDSGETYFSGDGYPDNPMQFMELINSTDYVYFKTDPTSDKILPIPKTPYVESLFEQGADSAGYLRKSGREGLDFLWQHFTPFTHLIDPSTTNIIDIYVLTRSYYVNTLNYINGIFEQEPQPPTSLQLSNSYNELLTTKMISDTVVMHSGKFKLLFGNLAQPELRATFKIIQKTESRLTPDQLKIKTLGIINQYFAIENWDFGQTFYATELIAAIHKELSTEIESVVPVPTFPINYFGSLFVIEAGEDEILQSAATIDDIFIVKGLDKITIKQKQ